MRGVAITLGRMIVVVAAVLAQFVPDPWVLACDRGCCAAAATAPCCPGAAPRANEAAGPCPLCRASDVAACDAEAPPPPCRCQLDARQDDATAAPDRTTLDLRPTSAPGVVPPIAPLPGGEALSARALEDHARSVVSRPVRILYGVWRN